MRSSKEVLGYNEYYEKLKHIVDPDFLRIQFYKYSKKPQSNTVPKI